MQRAAEEYAENASGSGADNSTQQYTKAYKNNKGEFTNGEYTIDSKGMSRHTDGSTQSGKSQFWYDVDSNQAVLEAASYAEKTIYGIQVMETKWILKIKQKSQLLMELLELPELELQHHILIFIGQKRDMFMVAQETEMKTDEKYISIIKQCKAIWLFQTFRIASNNRINKE